MVIITDLDDQQILHIKKKLEAKYEKFKKGAFWLF